MRFLPVGGVNVPVVPILSLAMGLVLSNAVFHHSSCCSLLPSPTSLQNLGLHLSRCLHIHRNDQNDSTHPCKPQLLKPTRLEPMLHNKRSHRDEKPMHRSKE
ncbi:hypothetical protein J1605_006197 [Eschrichtius robustus]|uniref:Secreted protein n=1 Tax=Eschrichtius robustus TaxID=9764 RepID=A0AB34H349_ESCRO|nr:hypothetical protein J1605_006197 [Eschrichtius robustus]